MLSCRNISKSYQGVQVITGIDLSVSPGEIVALIGPSGGGKSTFLRNLAMLEYPDCGGVSIDGKEFCFPLGKQSPPKVHPTISLVFQQFHLWPHLSLRENLLMPLKLRGQDVDWEEFKQQLSFFEIDTLLERYPYEVSVGQRQRTALLRAALLKPKYLLLDEITSALDVQHVSNVLTFVQTLAARGTGIIIATHLLRFAAKVASHVAFLNRGVVVEQGTTSLLFAPESTLLKLFLSHSD